MRVALLLFAVGAFAIAMLLLGPPLRVDGFRSGVKELVARVEAKVFGYESLP